MCNLAMMCYLAYVCPRFLLGPGHHGQTHQPPPLTVAESPWRDAAVYAQGR